jgi:hypothetical protein
MNPRTWPLFAALAASVLGVSCALYPAHVPAKLLPPNVPARDANAGPPSSGSQVDTLTLLLPSDINQNYRAFHSQDEDVIYSRQTCGGGLGFLASEWQNIERPSNAPSPMRLIHGWIAASEFSGTDFWGTHRYKDWDIVVVVSDNLQGFLAPANDPLVWRDGIVQVLRSDNPDIKSLMEIEWDSGFFPWQMAPGPRDEVLLVGRWDFDCGHEGYAPKGSAEAFRSEIHAPAIMISSHIEENTPSSIRICFKVFAGSRSGPMDATTWFSFIEKFWSSHINPLGGGDYSVKLRAPQEGWKLASCKVENGTHTGGRRTLIKAQVGPGDDGASLIWTLPGKTYPPSARIESSSILHAVWVPGTPGVQGVEKCE